MSIRKPIFCLVFVGLFIVTATVGFSQLELEDDNALKRSYRVRVLNDMGQDICVKIIPYGRANYFHANLAPNRSKTSQLWSGDRVVCVWDDKTGEVLLTTGVHINRNGLLRIRPVWAMRLKTYGAHSRPKSAAPAILMLKIEPEN